MDTNLMRLAARIVIGFVRRVNDPFWLDMARDLGAATRRGALGRYIVVGRREGRAWALKERRVPGENLQGFELLFGEHPTEGFRHVELVVVTTLTWGAFLGRGAGTGDWMFDDHVRLVGHESDGVRVLDGAARAVLRAWLEERHGAVGPGSIRVDIACTGSADASARIDEIITFAKYMEALVPDTANLAGRLADPSPGARAAMIRRNAEALDDDLRRLAIDALRKDLQTWATRVAALDAYGRVGLGGADADRDLVPHLGDLDADVVAAAARALGLLGTLDAVRSLLPVRDAGDTAAVRQAAAAAIVQIQSRSGWGAGGMLSVAADQGAAGGLSVVQDAPDAASDDGRLAISRGETG